MKVILEAQHAVGHPQLRGVGIYSVEIIKALLKRNKNEYELTYFDYNREMGNYERAEKYFGKYMIPMHECNKLDYRVASREDNVFNKYSYNDYSNTNGDIYHFMCPVSFPTNLKGKMVVTVHDVLWEAFPGITPPHTEKLHKVAKRRLNILKPYVIAVSEATKMDILKYTDIPENSISVIYLSYDEKNMFYENFDVSNIVEGDYFLFIGAFESRKNIVRIIKAFNIIAEKNRYIKLVLTGKKVWDDISDLKEAVNASLYKDRIIFTGYVDVCTKRRLLSNAVGFIFPSICEGFGIPVLEAMACRCPVITADNTSLFEVGGKAALYVNAYDIEEISYAMNRILQSKTLRDDMIAKGLIHKTQFSWDKTARKTEDFYSYIFNK